MDGAAVTDGPRLRTYFGSPLLGSKDGLRLGNLCMVSSEPQPFSPQECVLLVNLAGGLSLFLILMNTVCPCAKIAFAAGETLHRPHMPSGHDDQASFTAVTRRK